MRAAAETARALAKQVFMERREVKATVVARYGPLPSAQAAEALSLWVAAVLPSKCRREKHDLLAGRDTLERLRFCIGKLQALEARLGAYAQKRAQAQARAGRGGSSGSGAGRRLLRAVSDAMGRLRLRAGQ